MSEDVTPKEDWMNAKWRPMMGWMYMLVCTMDFVVFPIFWSLLQAMNHGRVETQWSPITLQGAGLFHMAMGAIIGVAAFGRTQEKLAGVNNGGSTTPTSGFTTPSTPQAGFGTTPGGFGSPAPAASGFGGGGFGSVPTAPTATSFAPAPSWGTTPIASTAGGKKVVPDFDQPAI